MKLALIIDFGDQLISYCTMGHLDLGISDIGFRGWAPRGRGDGADLLVAFENKGVLSRLIALHIEHGKTVSRPVGLLFQQRCPAIEKRF